MLSSLIMIQDLLIEAQRPRSRPVHVVAVVRCPQSVKVANYMVRDLAQGTMTAELLQPDELVSGLMAQVSPCLCLWPHGSAQSLLVSAKTMSGKSCADHCSSTILKAACFVVHEHASVCVLGLLHYLHAVCDRCSNIVTGALKFELQSIVNGLLLGCL